MKKLLAVGVIALFLGLACAPSINANVSKESDPIEINIYAGHFKKNIGYFGRASVTNNKNENVTAYFNYSCYFISFLLGEAGEIEFNRNRTIPPGETLGYLFGIILWGVEFFTITVECDNVILSKFGIDILNLVILFRK